MSAGYFIYSLDWFKFRQVVDRPTQAQLMRMGKLLRAGLKENHGEFDDGDPLADWPTDATALAEIAAKRLAMPDWYGDLSETGKNIWQGMIFDACMKGKDIDVGFRVDSDGVYWDVIELAWKKLGVVPKVISNVAMSTFGTRPYRYHPPAGPAKTREEYDRQEPDRQAALKEVGKLLAEMGNAVAERRKRLNQQTHFEKLAKEKKPPNPDQLLNALEDDLQNAFGALELEFAERYGDADNESDDEEIDFGPWTPMHSMHPPEEVQKMLAELESLRPTIKAAKKMYSGTWTDYSQELVPALERIVADGRMLFVQVDT